MPRQINRARKIRTNLFIGQPYFFPHFIPHHLLAGYSQWHIHSVQRHPIDKTLPILPFPKRHGIAVSTIIQEKAIIHFRFYDDRFFHHRQHIGHFDRNIGIPRYSRQTIIFQIIIQSGCHRIGVIPANVDFSVLTFQRIVIPILLRSYLEHKSIGILGD